MSDLAALCDVIQSADRWLFILHESDMVGNRFDSTADEEVASAKQQLGQDLARLGYHLPGERDFLPPIVNMEPLLPETHAAKDALALLYMFTHGMCGMKLSELEWATRTLEEVAYPAEHRDGMVESGERAVLDDGSTQRPAWDKDRRVWTYGDIQLKRLKQPAPNVEVILDQFEAHNWARRIQNPFRTGVGQRSDAEADRKALYAIKNLRNGLICFHQTGNGGIVWERRATCQRCSGNALRAP